MPRRDDVVASTEGHNDVTGEARVPIVSGHDSIWCLGSDGPPKAKEPGSGACCPICGATVLVRSDGLLRKHHSALVDGPTQRYEAAPDHPAVHADGKLRWRSRWDARHYLRVVWVVLATFLGLLVISLAPDAYREFTKPCDQACQDQKAQDAAQERERDIDRVWDEAEERCKDSWLRAAGEGLVGGFELWDALWACDVSAGRGAVAEEYGKETADQEFQERFPEGLYPPPSQQ